MKAIKLPWRLPIWLALPALGILVMILIIPAVQLFLVSLKQPDYSLANYQAFFLQSSNVRVLLQTLEISLVVTGLCLLIGYPTAYAIVMVSARLRMTLIVLILIPYLTSFLARTYAWIVILGDNGLVNNLLRNIGAIDTPLPLLYTRLAVYVGMVHIMLPLMILPLVSVMMGIDKSLPMAARSMGARPLSAFWRVFFPLSLPGVRSGTLLVFVLCLGFYITPAALGGLGDAMLSTFIAAESKSVFDLGRVATSAFVLLLIAMIVLSIMGLDLSGSSSRASTTRRGGSWRNRLRVPGRVASQVFELTAKYRRKRWAAERLRIKSGGDLGVLLGSAIVSLVLAFLLFPGVVVIIMSFSAGAYLEFPPSGISLQWYRSFFSDPSWTSAASTSIQIGAAVTLVSTFAGTLAAYGMSDVNPALRKTLTMVVLTPITMPVIVVGIAVYYAFIKMSLIGSTWGIVLAQSIGATSYVVVIVSATLANFDRRLEQAAMSLGAGPIRTFRRVTLPLILPGIAGGAVFAFIHSFDEVVITSLVSGYSVKTLPLKMWENIRHTIDPTIAAVSSLLMLLPVLWLVAIYFTWWRSIKSPAFLSSRGDV
ncbi:ABC transporter permease subunit [Mesorhizobium sp. M0203]|uniref:ABC transporter permease subunit n=1 Tax=Mesorhizobium sp. M0203 TaxID=2956912 RepID=UPI00333D84F7